MLSQLVPKPDSKWGMCMALRLSRDCVTHSTSGLGIGCWAGYESGHVILWRCDMEASVIHEKQLHSEAIMAMCIAPDNLGKPSLSHPGTGVRLTLHLLERFECGDFCSFLMYRPCTDHVTPK